MLAHMRTDLIYMFLRRQVGFIHEDELCEVLQATVEKLLLGANVSRTFYTQTLLPLPLSQADPLSSKAATGARRALRVHVFVCVCMIVCVCMYVCFSQV